MALRLQLIHKPISVTTLINSVNPGDCTDNDTAAYVKLLGNGSFAAICQSALYEKVVIDFCRYIPRVQVLIWMRLSLPCLLPYNFVQGPDYSVLFCR